MALFCLLKLSILIRKERTISSSILIRKEITKSYSILIRKEINGTKVVENSIYSSNGCGKLLILTKNHKRCIAKALVRW